MALRVAVLGAGGIIGPAIVRDLADSEEVETLTLLDLDGQRARAVAEQHGGGRATGAAVDAADRQALTLALEGCDLLVNAASYRVNLAAMDACLSAGCSSVDLGGLFHVTQRQLRLGEAFAERGLLAVLGAGAGPGKTNVMAAQAAAELDEVVCVRCSSAGLDADPPSGFSTPYAVQTLLEELSVPPVVFRGGRHQEVGPRTSGGEVDFPAPIGRRDSLLTIHSEVLTLPESLGAEECLFRLSLGPGVRDGLEALLDRPAEERAAVRPVPPSPRTFSAQHVEVTGRRAGRDVSVVATALTPPHEDWGLGGGIVSTASAAAATVRLFARGKLPYAGALPPERCLAAGDLFPELERRGTRFELHPPVPRVREVSAP